MWRWLHPYAKPEATYRLNQKLLPWFAIPGVIVLTVAMIWGLAFAPADYQQGDSYRIIFTHVPAAIWSMGFYMGMAIAALIAIVWQIRHCRNGDSQPSHRSVRCSLLFRTLDTALCVRGKPL